MGRRKTIALDMPAGVVKRTGPYQEPGRWIDMDKVRFVKGKPQKIGGWIRKAISQLLGTPRGAHSWNTLNNRTTIAVGTTRKLYAISTDATSITPYQGDPVTLTNAFSTTAGSADVTVTQAGHAKIPDQAVIFSALSGPVGGLNLAGEFRISRAPTADTYVVQAATPATATVTNQGSATATYEIPPFTQNPAAGFGYGVGGYGQLTYGTARPETNVLFDAGYWSLDHFGQLLLAAPYQGMLYEWDPTATPVPRATRVANSPGGMRSFFVTPERFIVCLGASTTTQPGVDPMVVRWCSQNDRTTWDASPTSSANTRRLTEGKRLMGGGAVGGGVSLIWSDSALYSMQFTGSQSVYATNLQGTNCGLAGPTAFVCARGAAFWFGSNAFHQFGGSVDRIANSDDIAEWVVNQLRPYFETKTVCFYNERWNEVWWLFVPTDQDEPAFYAAVELSGFKWATGTLQRTSATKLDGSDVRPILTSPDGYLYIHEQGTDADGAAMPAFIQSGQMEVQKGDVLTSLLGFMPDVGLQNGDLTLTVSARDRGPGDIIDQSVDTVPVGTGLVDLRLRGRTFDFRLSSSAVGGTFAIGTPALEIMNDGRVR